MPSVPGTLLRMIAMPAVQTCAPQVAFSGLAKSPRPKLAFDSDLLQIGNMSNCTILVPAFPKQGNQRLNIAGVTRDGSNAALAGCIVDLFTSADKTLRYSTISDAGGNFSFDVPSNGWTWFARAYLSGSPDVAGTTINNLTVTVI